MKSVRELREQLNEFGIGKVIVSSGYWELMHADTERDHLHHKVAFIHHCPDDPDYVHWGEPSQENPDAEMECSYCKEIAPPELVKQWLHLIKEVSDDCK